MFNAHYYERCFLPIHVYDTATSRPVAVLLRPGKTPSGTEVRGHLHRLTRLEIAKGPHAGSAISSPRGAMIPVASCSPANVIGMPDMGRERRR